MLVNRKVDVIIPAYNVPDDILFQCLSSIATQTIKDQIKVTIVDDASTKENYENIKEKFSEFLDIQILKLENNVGPGAARQYGIDHTENEFITFIDADDLFANGFSLEILRQVIEVSPTHQMCVGVFQEVYNSDNQVCFLNHIEDMVWMFGKMYRRMFLDRHNIRFHETSRANEDAGFNTLCKLYSSENEQIIFIEDTVYFWCNMNENSITRRDDCYYSFSGEKDGSFYGYIENMIRSIKQVLNDPTIRDHQYVYEYAANCMVVIYCQYLSNLRNAKEEDSQKNFEWCRLFYNEIYRFLEETQPIPFDVMERIYAEGVKGAYATDSLFNVIPEFTFYQFLDSLKNNIYITEPIIEE